MNSIELHEAEVLQIAASCPGDPVALVLTIETLGLAGEHFRLPTRSLAAIDLLPGWQRHDYRRAIRRAVARGLVHRDGPAHPGRAGTRYWLPAENGSVFGPPGGP